MSATENPEPLTAGSGAPPDRVRARVQGRRAHRGACTPPRIRRSAPDCNASPTAAERLRGDANATITVTARRDAARRPRPRRSPIRRSRELAALLHAHLIGELSLQGDLTTTAWHAFLTILARAPEDVRAEGGIGRAWMAAGGGPIEIRQIDYCEVLRERSGGQRRRMGAADRELPRRRAADAGRRRRWSAPRDRRGSEPLQGVHRAARGAGVRDHGTGQPDGGARGKKEKSCCRCCRRSPITWRAPIRSSSIGSCGRSPA